MFQSSSCTWLWDHRTQPSKQAWPRDLPTEHIKFHHYQYLYTCTRAFFVTEQKQLTHRKVRVHTHKGMHLYKTVGGIRTYIQLNPSKLCTPSLKIKAPCPFLEPYELWLITLEFLDVIYIYIMVIQYWLA